jgi:hypothetical protein
MGFNSVFKGLNKNIAAIYKWEGHVSGG